VLRNFPEEWGDMLQGIVNTKGWGLRNKVYVRCRKRSRKGICGGGSRERVGGVGNSTSLRDAGLGILH